MDRPRAKSPPRPASDEEALAAAIEPPRPTARPDALLPGTRLEEFEIERRDRHQRLRAGLPGQRRGLRAPRRDQGIFAGHAGDARQRRHAGGAARQRPCRCLRARPPRLHRGGAAAGALPPSVAGACAAPLGDQRHRLPRDAVLPRAHPARSCARRWTPRPTRPRCARCSRACSERWKSCTRPARCTARSHRSTSCCSPTTVRCCSTPAPPAARSSATRRAR